MRPNSKFVGQPLYRKVSLSLLVLLLVTTCVLGQYSSDDCTGPEIIGSDNLFGCTNGILFSVSPLPRETFHTVLVVQVADSAPSDLRFNFTYPGASLAFHVDTEGQLRSYNPGPGRDEIYVVATRCGVASLRECCRQSGGGLPIKGCPTDYGMYFEVDGDRDGEFDDMAVAFIDGTAVPLNFRFLFVPLNWTGTQAQFDAAAQRQVNLFAGATTLGRCADTIEAVTLDVNTQNFNSFTCSQDNCEIDSVRRFLRTLGLKSISYDVVIGMLPGGSSPCAPRVGCSNVVDTVWIEDSNDPILAHEIGHIYGLEDEYCSEEAGGDTRCAGPGDVNRLGIDLGCNPQPNAGCCADCSAAGNPAGTGNYFACCQGNDGALGGGSKCIMSSAGAGLGAQNWCRRCLDHLSGRNEFDCDRLPTTPFRNVLEIDLTISQAGEVSLNAVELGKGRPTRIDRKGNRYRMVLDAPAGRLLDERFDVIHYDVALPQKEANIHYQVPVDISIDDPPPVVLSVFEGGSVVFQETLFEPEPPGPWDAHFSKTAQDAFHFIIGEAPYNKPHAVVTVAATNQGCYLFYRDDLEPTSGWRYKVANTPEDAHNFLNRLGAYTGEPIDKALLAYKAPRELYLFCRGRSSKARWGWKRATNVEDMHNFINGAGAYEEPREGTVGGFNPYEVLMFYRSDLEGSGRWGWKFANNLEDGLDFLNGKGSYQGSVQDAKVFATTDGSFYIFYRRTTKKGPGRFQSRQSACEAGTGTVPYMARGCPCLVLSRCRSRTGRGAHSITARRPLQVGPRPHDRWRRVRRVSWRHLTCR